MTVKRVKMDFSEDQVFTLSGAARYAKTTRQTLTKHLAEISHRRLPGKILITRAALDRWLEGYDAKEDK